MSTPLFMCHRCARSWARTQPSFSRPIRRKRVYSTSNDSQRDATVSAAKTTATAKQNEEEPSAMSRRLEEATEEALLTGGRAGRRAVEEAGFSEELKDRLLEKIADARFQADHSSTLAAAGLDPSSMHSVRGAGAGTRNLAAAQPWTGEEATADAVLRMLDDARKPLPPSLRGKPKIPDPIAVDMRLRRPTTQSPGQRVASARDKAMAYVNLEQQQSEKAAAAADKGLTADEREALRKEFRDRFGPGVRSAAMPSTITGLAALANERIEDAIARGQFRDIPRGKGVAEERDHRADSPFIDTTEYIMNKMIQRQDIVPPWIEKQQELVRTAHSFRQRLRTDWRRHAARTIAARGGTLESQMALARRYARAEQAHNPRRRAVDQIAVPTNMTEDAVAGRRAPPSQKAETTEINGVAVEEEDDTPDLTPPLRDPQWEAAERAYMELAVAQLNALTRSYNLMAPELAKKPYFSLDRELRACFADVAPTLAETIRERAARPAKPATDAMGDAVGRRVLDRFVGEGGAGAARIYDSKTPNYGLKEMWRDLWKRAE